MSPDSVGVNVRIGRRMTRISVIGGPGTGKTTFAARVAAITGAPHVELDALWWGPSWTPVELATFRERVRDAVAGDAWVIEGYYLDEAVRPIVWPRAEVIVWLDLPRSSSVARALRRSAGRALRRTELWGTNTQSARVLTPLSVARFIRRWPAYPSSIGQALETDPLERKTVVRLRNDEAIETWLAALALDETA